MGEHTVSEERAFVRAQGDSEGPDLIVKRSQELYESIVPKLPDGLDFLAGRIALTVDEAAPALGVSVRTLRAAIRDGDIPSMKLKGRRLIPLRALERHLEALAYTESGALDSWETAMARAVSTRLGRARREAYLARRELKRKMKDARRRAADLKDAPGTARAVAEKVVTDLVTARTQLTIEEQLASNAGKALLSDIEDLQQEFGLEPRDILK